MKRRRLALGLVTAATLGLSACGFHLRGTGAAIEPADTGPVFISAPAQFQAVSMALRQVLKTNRFDVVDEPVAEALKVQIINEQSERRIAALDQSGQPVEYELRYRLDYRLTGPDGAVVLPAQTINLSRDYAFDPQRLLSLTEQEAQARDEMRTDAAQMIARRLAAFAENAP